MINVKAAVIIACVVIIATLTYVYKGLFIAATINGVPVSRFSVIREMEKTSGKNTLNAIITKKLIGNEALKKGVSVTDDKIEAEIARIEEQIKSQGSTLEATLAGQGMNREDLKGQIIIQKELEGILADKIQVADDEIAKFIKDNKITVPEGQETNYKDQITAQLRQQKLNSQAASLIESLKSQAEIKYFVDY